MMLSAIPKFSLSKFFDCLSPRDHAVITFDHTLVFSGFWVAPVPSVLFSPSLTHSGCAKYIVPGFRVWNCNICVWFSNSLDICTALGLSSAAAHEN